MRRLPGFIRHGFLAAVMGSTALFVVSASGGGPETVGPKPVDQAALDRLETPPLGLPPVVFPDGEPPSAEMIALGRKLFFDRRLGRNDAMSCAVCHIPEQGFTNNELATPIGVEGRSLRRNAPTLLNVAYQETLFHDGRETRLENQVIAPLIDRDEMANPSIGMVLDRIEELPDYDGLFEAAFNGPPSIDRFGRAVAAWERSLLSANSAFDRWRYGGEPDALTKEQIQGFDLFTGRAGCAGCHTVGETYALFTDNGFHDTGIGYRRDLRGREKSGSVKVEIAPNVSVLVKRDLVDSVGDPPRPDQGRLEATDRPEDLWRFKTPSLRNAALTAPYMHDGSLPTLKSVVDYYNAGGASHRGLDPSIRPLDLSPEEVDALVAFLQGLTGDNLADLVTDARSAPYHRQRKGH